MNALSATEGTPLVRPMYWAYSESNESYSVPNEYLFGSSLLVMAITEAQDPALRLAKTKGWLPPGKYVDIFSGAVYHGDRSLWISRKLEEYPVFAKEGTIIPLDAATEPGNGEANPENIEILVVVGADGEFELLEDDGSGSTAEEVKWTKTPITYTQVAGTVTIWPSTGAISKESRGWRIRFLGLSPTKDITASIGKDKPALKIEKAHNGTVVHVGKIPLKTKATISLGAKPELRRNDIEALVRPVLADAQIKFQLKEDVWQIVTAKISSTLKVSRLHALEMSENLRHAVLEFILAD